MAHLANNLPVAKQSCSKRSFKEGVIIYRLSERLESATCLGLRSLWMALVNGGGISLLCHVWQPSSVDDTSAALTPCQLWRTTKEFINSVYSVAWEDF